MDTSQRRDLTQQMHRTTGSYELVLSPLLLALIGFWLDHVFDTLPWLTIIFAVVGLSGAVIKLYYGYRTEMEAHEAEGAWNIPGRRPNPAAVRLQRRALDAGSVAPGRADGTAEGTAGTAEIAEGDGDAASNLVSEERP